MRFNNAIVVLFAATALAAPAQVHKRGVFGDIGNALGIGGDSSSSAAAAAPTAASNAAASSPAAAAAAPTGTCDLGKCALALGPAAAACGGSVAQLGVDPITDAACVAASLNDVANKPESCNGCSKEL